MGFLHWVGQRFAKPHDPKNVRMGQRLVIGAVAVGGALLIPGVGAAVVHGAGSAAGAVGRGALGGAKLLGRGAIGGGKAVGRGLVSSEKAVAGFFRRKTGNTDTSTDNLGALRDELSSNPGNLDLRGLPEPGRAVSVDGFVPVPPTAQASGNPTNAADPKAVVSPLILAAVVLGVIMIARK